MPGTNETAAIAALAAAKAKVESARAAYNATGGYDTYDPTFAALQLALRELASAQDAVGAARTSDQQQVAGGQRQDVIYALDRTAKGYGTAYSTTMGQVNQGNQRIAALAASGRGGLNAGVNSQNAQALNKTAGHQQATAAKAAEMSQARGALGQAIAAGQDYNAAEGQATLEALRNTPAAAPNQAMQTAGQVGAVGQAIWSANQGNQPNPNDKNKTRSGW